MPDRDALLKQVQAAIERAARIDLQNGAVSATLSDGALILAGTVADIAAKKRAVRAASGVAGISRIVDQLRVASDELPPGDGATRDAVCKWLLRDIDFQNCAVHLRAKGKRETLREAGPDSAGTLEVAVSDGVVTLSGQVISLSHKRLAGVLAWWSRGCRDVINELAVIPPEDDNDDEIVEAVSLVLEADPNVHAGQVKVTCAERVVTLDGSVGSEGEKKRAEMDAWFVHGVDQVINRVEVT